MVKRKNLFLVKMKIYENNIGKYINSFYKEDNSEIQEQFACEHADLDLSCEDGKVLKIIYANYGRRVILFVPDAGGLF